ncbi:hypothetical protein E1A91_A13G125100v1 [Gossypium mustelinum]|uniref:Uncharacterized protein n=1 Tax=Gossypium mustelinum TaxID=34275 RepID=A0A5D2WHM8_GOSMU|nr:hypothetical protein E1A91_A13G125100v1 [Gossypium mustelinum]
MVSAKQNSRVQTINWVQFIITDLSASTGCEIGVLVGSVYPFESEANYTELSNL